MLNDSVFVLRNVVIQFVSIMHIIRGFLQNIAASLIIRIEEARIVQDIGRNRLSLLLENKTELMLHTDLVMIHWRGLWDYRLKACLLL